MTESWFGLLLQCCGVSLVYSAVCPLVQDDEWPKVNGTAFPSRFVVEGTEMTFVCNGSPHPNRPLLEIKFNFVPLNKIISCKKEEGKPLTNCVHVIPKINTSYTGMVLCAAQDKFKCRHTNFTIEVIDKRSARAPEVILTPSGIHYVPPGGSVLLQCKASGRPPPRVEWFKTDVSIRKYYQHNYNSSLSTEISFKDFSTKNQATYKCEADNGVGDKVTESVELLIEEKGTPTFTNRTKKEEESSTSVSAAAIVVPFLLLPVIGIICFLCLRSRRKRKQAQAPQMIMENVLDGAEEDAGDDIEDENTRQLFQDEQDEEADDHSIDEEDPRFRDIPRDELEFLELVGEGQFGKIMSALYRPEENEAVKVAVKMPHEGNGKLAEDLNSELVMLKKVGYHKNIVNLMGACTEKEPIYIVLEFIPNGDLRTYLLEQRLDDAVATAGPGNLRCLLNERQLLGIAADIASGMKYLAARKCVHRDLAARNILLGENYEAKITDFGLARDVQMSGAYVRTRACALPMKWMAPESLIDLKSSSESDIWSFGIVLWEIIMLGETPYPEIASFELLTRKLVMENYRMPRPPHCSSKLYQLMMKCWATKPSDRIKFKSIHRVLRRMLEDKEHTYVNIAVNKT